MGVHVVDINITRGKTFEFMFRYADEKRLYPRITVCVWPSHLLGPAKPRQGVHLKFHSAGVDTSRFLLNSTVGLVGLIDIATPMGLRRSDEDFGQTLGHWGVNSGPYLVLPLLGPSSLRDAPAVLPDAYANPVRYIGDVPARNSLYGVSMIDGRAQYIKSEKLITGDKYNFMRSVYLQSREFKIRAGNVEDDF